MLRTGEGRGFSCQDTDELLNSCSTLAAGQCGCLMSA